MAQSSRERFLETVLGVLEYENALKALDLVRMEMNADKGYKRHNGSHYYYHLIDVTLFIYNAGIKGEDLYTAALLHDIVEDVPGYTVNTIEKLFGPTVAHYVKVVTKDPNIKYKEDKEALVEYLHECSLLLETAIIKTSDRIHNLWKEVFLSKWSKPLILLSFT